MRIDCKECQKQPITPGELEGTWDKLHGPQGSREGTGAAKRGSSRVSGLGSAGSQGKARAGQTVEPR